MPVKLETTCTHCSRKWNSIYPEEEEEEEEGEEEELKEAVGIV
jgi:hypothetical protein